MKWPNSLQAFVFSLWLTKKPFPQLHLQSGATETGSNRKPPLRAQWDCTHVGSDFLFSFRERTGLTSHWELGYHCNNLLSFALWAWFGFSKYYNTSLLASRLIKKFLLNRNHFIRCASPEMTWTLKSYRIYKMAAQGHYITLLVVSFFFYYYFACSPFYLMVYP